MFNYHCLNPISDVGLEEFTEEYVPVSGPEKADALLVRSAVMHEMEFGKELKAIARAGAGVNNMPPGPVYRGRDRGLQHTGSQRQRGQGAGDRRHAPCLPGYHRRYQLGGGK